VFGLPVRRGEAPSWVKDDLKDPMFSTVLGVFQFGFKHATEHHVPARRKSGSVFASLTKFFS
jgi:cell division protein FtsA